MKMASNCPQVVVAVGRQGDAGLEVVVGAPRQVLDIKPPSEPLADRSQDLEGLGGDVLADAVARDECDAHGICTGIIAAARLVAAPGGWLVGSAWQMAVDGVKTS